MPGPFSDQLPVRFRTVPGPFSDRYSLFGLLVYLLKKRNAKFIVALCVMGVVFFFAAQYLNLMDSVIEMTVNKSSSGSAEVRSKIMMSGFDILKNTYGLGIGLGASNGSGIALTLLGQIGILGCGLFGTWLYFILKFLKNRQIRMQLCLWIVLFGMCISVGYLSFPIFWLELIIICCTHSNMLDKKNAV